MGLCFRIVLRQSPSLESSLVYADVSGHILEWLLLPSFARAMKGPFSDSHDEKLRETPCDLDRGRKK